jgi:hypothetical protein
MKDLQRLGGVASLYAAAAYVLGLIYYLFVVDYADADEPLEKVALLVDHETSLYIMTLLLYVLFGAVLVVLTLALADRFKAGATAVVRSATAFGLIWAGLLIASGMVHNVGLGNVVDRYGADPAQAASAWLAIESVSNGLGGEYEIVGGVWIILVSWAAMQARGLPRAATYLGVVTGLAGLLSIIPAITEVAVGLFALGQIVWFIWLGIVMLRGSAGTSTPQVEAIERS